MLRPLMYVTTDTIESSVRFCRGVLDEVAPVTFPGRIDVPTAVAEFRRELPNVQPPRSLIEYSYNLTRYTRMPRRGHFAALEQPGLFSNDGAEFFSRLQNAPGRF